MKLIYIDEIPENPYIPSDNLSNMHVVHRVFDEGQQSILQQPDLMPYMDEIINSYSWRTGKSPTQFIQECASVLPLKGLTIEQIKELRK